MRKFEEKWEHLKSNLELSAFKGIFFIECEDIGIRNALRKKIREYCLKNSLMLVEPESYPAGSKDLLEWLGSVKSSTGTDSENPPKVIFLPMPYNESEERKILHRLNEHRDSLIEEIRGILIITGLSGFLVRARSESPDLWSMGKWSFGFTHYDFEPIGSLKKRVGKVPEEKGYKYDAFISYSSRDIEFVEKLYRKLTNDGVHCFFDKKSVEWGENFVLALEKGLEESKHVVIIMSPDYFKSDWAKIERVVTQMQDPANLQRKILPIMRRDTEIPGFLKSIQYIKCRNNAEFNKEYPKICKTLGGKPDMYREELKFERGKMPKVPLNLPENFNVPYPSLKENFVGREKEIWELHDALMGKGYVVVSGVTADESMHGFGVAHLSGIAGIGKSQLAVEYAYRFSPFYPGGIFWIRAERSTNIEAARTIATTAGFTLPENEGENRELEMMWAELRRFPPCLIVLDNLPEKGGGIEIQDWIPRGGEVRVLVTSRKKFETRFARVVEVPLLTKQEGLKLLFMGDEPRDEREKNAGEGIVEELGRLPLAIEIAGSFIRIKGNRDYIRFHNLLSNSNVLSRIEESARRFSEQLPTGHEKSIFLTFEESWKNFSAKAKNILIVLGFMSPEPVPEWFLRNIMERLGITDGKEAMLGDFTFALNELKDVFFIHWNSSDGYITIHRLILDFAYIKFIENEKSWRDSFNKTIEEMQIQLDRIWDPHDTTAMHEIKDIFPHAEHIIDMMYKKGGFEIVDKLSSSLYKYFSDTGIFNKAKFYAERALEIAQKTYGKEHPVVATRLSNLALILKDLGEVSSARPLMERALEIDEKTYGKEHPKVATSLSNLALILRDLGEVSSARSLMERALEIAEKTYGKEHPETITIRNNLNLILQFSHQIKD